MSQKRRDSQLTIRIPKRLREELDAQAEIEQCTVADVLNSLLEKRYPAPAERRRR